MPVQVEEAEETEIREGEQVGPGRWEAVLIIEGERTTDFREIAEGALGWRELPLPLMFLDSTGMGHDGAVIAGSIEEITREGNELRAKGSFDAGPDGQNARRLVEEQTLRWISADIESTDFEIIEEGDCSDEGWMDGNCKVTERVLKGRVIAATVVPMPAFPGAVIVPEGAEIPEATEDGRPASILAGAYPVAPSSECFQDPGLLEPTPLTIDGPRVFGHLAGPDCHLGRQDRCLTVGTTSRDFSRFNDGVLVTAEGDEVHVGQITLVGGHADLYVDANHAAAHYDDTRSAIADVTVGWDERNGLPWFSGALRPSTTDEQLRVLRASGVSGDWRPIQGERKLIAALAVNVPAWGVPRTHALVADGRVTAVVAAPVERVEPWRAAMTEMREEMSVMTKQIRHLTAIARPLMSLSRQALLKDIAPTSGKK